MKHKQRGPQMTSGNNSTFVKITNRDIYDAIRTQNEKIDELKQHVIATNGKVKKAWWAATTALTLIVFVAGLLMSHLGR